MIAQRKPLDRHGEVRAQTVVADPAGDIVAGDDRAADRKAAGSHGFAERVHDNVRAVRERAWLQHLMVVLKHQPL